MTQLSTIESKVTGRALWSDHILAEERRSTPRVSRTLTTTLVSPRGGDSVCCATRDLSEGGLFLFVPPGAKLSVGQRYEIMLSSDRGPSSADAVYGTVVRTEVVVRDDQPALGAGMRFDQPLWL